MPLNSTDWTAPDPLAFLARWAAAVADALNKQPPAGASRFVAEIASQTREGARAAIVPLTSAPPAFDPSPPTHGAPARFTDRVGVDVIDTSGGRQVAAVVLFVTPDNKADSDAALAFAVRAAGFMSSGAGVVIADAVPGPPSWATHLHSLTGVYPITRRPRGPEAPILVVHPFLEGAGGTEQFAVWHHAVGAGFPLPTVPVPVRGAAHLKLDLEATYAEACRNSRVP